jgi:hypothetical protein
MVTIYHAELTGKQRLIEPARAGKLVKYAL